MQYYCKFPDIPQFIHLLKLLFQIQYLEARTINYMWFIDYVEEWGLNLFEVSMCYSFLENDSGLL